MLFMIRSSVPARVLGSVCSTCIQTLANELISSVVQIEPSAGIESALFWHLCPVFVLGAVIEGHGGESEDNSTHDEGVGFPIRRLSIPTTSGRPDVLGVARRMGCQYAERH